MTKKTRNFGSVNGAPMALPSTLIDDQLIAVTQAKASASTMRNMTTEEFAEAVGMSPQTLRKRYSQTGSYFSVRPIKLPNRRLLWPADAVQQLINARH